MVDEPLKRAADDAEGLSGAGGALEESEGAGAGGQSGIEEGHELRLDRVRRERERREV